MVPAELNDTLTLKLYLPMKQKYTFNKIQNSNCSFDKGKLESVGPLDKLARFININIFSYFTIKATSNRYFIQR